MTVLPTPVGTKVTSGTSKQDAKRRSGKEGEFLPLPPFELSSRPCSFDTGCHVLHLRCPDWLEGAVAFSLCQVTTRRTIASPATRLPPPPLREYGKFLERRSCPCASHLTPWGPACLPTGTSDTSLRRHVVGRNGNSYTPCCLFGFDCFMGIADACRARFDRRTAELPRVRGNFLSTLVVRLCFSSSG